MALNLSIISDKIQYGAVFVQNQHDSNSALSFQ